MNIHLRDTMAQKKSNKKYIILVLILGTFLFSGFTINHSFNSAQYNREDMRMQRIQDSKQYKNGKFHNRVPWNQTPAFSTLWDFLFKNNQRTPQDSLPRQQVDLTFFNQSNANHLSATWLGHSSLLINLDGYKIVTDPVLEKRASIFGPTRYNGPLPVDIHQLTDIDVVLISHNHYDHLNKFSIRLLDPHTKRFIVPLAVGAQLEKWGVSRDKITEMDWWEEVVIGPDFKIAATPTQHFSGRSLTDRNKTLWASYVLAGPQHKIYFSGDSGYFTGFKQIGSQYGPFDMTFLECGAYNKAWRHIHMLPEETAQAHLDLKGNILHPIHWGTFNLSLHAWYEPMQRLMQAADSLGITVVTPVVGATTVFKTNLPQERWWPSLRETSKRADAPEVLPQTVP